jgi:hypothetical protein
MNHPDSLSQSNLPVTSIFALWPMSAGATLASLHFISFHLRTISSPSLSIVVLTVRLPKRRSDFPNVPVRSLLLSLLALLNTKVQILTLLEQKYKY